VIVSEYIKGAFVGVVNEQFNLQYFTSKDSQDLRSSGILGGVVW
jgi:hypothetical protein